MKKRRIKAEGLLIALETLAVAAMEQDGNDPRKASKKKPIVAMVEHNDKGYKIDNFPAVVFSLTHPWVEIHTDVEGCSNTDARHEKEYEGMLETVGAVLKDRLANPSLVDDEEEEGD